MRKDYTLEKFGLALRSMAASPRSLRQRIESAFIETSTLNETDIPADLRDGWNALKQQVTRFSSRQRGQETIGAIENTLEQLSDDEVVDIARKFVELYDRVRERIYGKVLW